MVIKQVLQNTSLPITPSVAELLSKMYKNAVDLICLLVYLTLNVSLFQSVISQLRKAFAEGFFTTSHVAPCHGDLTESPNL